MGTITSNGRSDRAARAAVGVAALGRRIHDHRTAQGLSLQEFAMLAGVAAPALSALERGEGATTLSTLFAAADALGVPMRSFVSVGEAAPEPQHPSTPPPPTRTTASDAAAPAPARGTAPTQDPAVAEAPAVDPASPAERAPRTFADLRKGALADRSFDSLPQFAVAAVIEARYSVAAIARVFRVPAWKLQGWVDEKKGSDSAAHRR